MRSLPILLLFSFLFCTGKYGDAFLGLGTSARNLGLGQSTVADIGNASGFNICPASISSIKNKTFYLLSVNQYGLAEYFSSGLAGPFKNNQFISFNISGLIVDDVQIRPDLGYIGSYQERRDTVRALFQSGYDSFNDLEFALTTTYVKFYQSAINAGFNKLYYELPIGINVRLIKKKLYDKEASGIGMDLGTILSLKLSDFFSYRWLGKFSIGVSINNIYGTHLVWSNELKDIIPMQIIKGIAYEQSVRKINTHIKLLTQTNDLYPNDLQYGIELSLMKNFFVRIGERAGTNQGGVGFKSKIIKNKEIKIDYSFGNHDLGDAHRFSIELEF